MNPIEPFHIYRQRRPMAMYDIIIGRRRTDWKKERHPSGSLLLMNSAMAVPSIISGSTDEMVKTRVTTSESMNAPSARTLA
jgi:hypothetical protein